MIVNSVITNGFITVQMSRPELETTRGKRSAETLTPKQCCFSISKTMQTTATAHYIELGGGKYQGHQKTITRCIELE